MFRKISLLVAAVMVMASCATKPAQQPDVQVGTYTISVVTDNVYHIQDYNDANPAGETFDADGNLTHFNNCSDMYLLVGKEKSLLIDLSNRIDWADNAVESLQKLVAERIGNTKLQITFTHNHGDHTGMLPAFVSNPDVQFLLPRVDFDRMRNRFPQSQTEMYEDGYSFDLGGMTVSTKLVPGHTPGSVVFFLDGQNIAFTGDAVGSGHGVWIFDRSGFRNYAKAVPELVEYIEARKDIKPAKLQLLGGHYWQKDWLTLKEGEPVMGMPYLYEMRDLIDQINAGTAETEPSNLSNPTLDTYFKNGNAIVVWNAQFAAELLLNE